MPREDPPKHTEVNRVARELNEEFESLSFEAVRRSVLRHWPHAEKYRMEVRAKAEQPCVLGIQLIGSQGAHIKLMQSRFYPVKTSSFPFFDSAFRNVSTGCARRHTWTDVLQKLNHPGTPRVHWICVSCPIGIAPSAERYEDIYAKVVLAEGIKDLVGFVHCCDGTLPFGDYIALRHMGGTKEEVAALVDFAALRDEAELVERHLQEDEDADEKWIIADNEEEAERMAEATAHAETSLSEADVARVKASIPTVQVTEKQAAAQAKRFYRQLNPFGNHPSQSISWRENKARMHRRLAEVGLNHIRSVEASSASEAEVRMAEAKLVFPVVVKPVSGAGSEFVTLCYSHEDVRGAFSLCKTLLTTQKTLAGNMVVEEYIDGSEYVVNAVSFEGRHVVTDVWKSWKYPHKSVSTRLRSSVETRLKEKSAATGKIDLPVPVPTVSLLYDRLEFVHCLGNLDHGSEPRRVVDYTFATMTALGMVNGCSHCEVRVDERVGSPTRGQPILIELNPRMQGDPPRATPLVGYDQYSLLYYLSAVAAAYEAPSETPFPIKVPQPLPSPEKGPSLPWPPVPVLYHSRHTSTTPGEEPVTRHVVFLSAPEAGVICSLGVRAVTALPTFLRVTRTNLFAAPKPGFLTSVSKTVDLYSSPGACVMEGTESDIRRDTARIRELEAARLPGRIRERLEAAVKVKSLQQKLRQRDKQLQRSFAEASRRVNALEPLFREAMAAAEAEPEDERRESKLKAMSEERLAVQSFITTISSEMREVRAEWQEANERFASDTAAAVKELMSAATPPLFLSQYEFSLFYDTGQCAFLNLDKIVGTEEEEAAAVLLVKHPRLKEWSSSEEYSPDKFASHYPDTLRRAVEWAKNLLLRDE